METHLTNVFNILYITIGTVRKPTHLNINQLKINET